MSRSWKIFSSRAISAFTILASSRGVIGVTWNASINILFLERVRSLGNRSCSSMSRFMENQLRIALQIKLRRQLYFIGTHWIPTFYLLQKNFWIITENQNHWDFKVSVGKKNSLRTIWCQCQLKGLEEGSIWEWSPSEVGKRP